MWLAYIETREKHKKNKSSEDKELYNRLDIQKKINEVHRLMKARKRKIRYLTNVRCVKKED